MSNSLLKLSDVPNFHSLTVNYIKYIVADVSSSIVVNNQIFSHLTENNIFIFVVSLMHPLDLLLYVFLSHVYNEVGDMKVFQLKLSYFLMVIKSTNS